MTTPDNPFAAAEVGEVYQRGRPYHHPRSLERVRAVVGTAAVGRALDVACGTGMSTLALAEFSRSVVGLDISADMMRFARPAPNVSYTLGNAETMGFTDAVFDAVTCSSGVHWFDQHRFFAEVRRVVRPGGWVGLYDHYFLDMDHVDAFQPWLAQLFDRFPLPPRNAQVGDPRAQTPTGFELLGTDLVDDPIPMTQVEFVDYQLSVSHCVAAAERGIPRAELRAWLLDSTAPLFGDAPTRVLRFVVSVSGLRRLP